MLGWAMVIVGILVITAVIALVSARGAAPMG